MESLPWQIWLIGSIVIAVLTLLGTVIGSKYFSDRASAARQVKRETDDLHQSNHGKEIEAGTAALAMMMKRIETVEAVAATDRKYFDERMNALQDKLTTSMANESRLDEQNKLLLSERKRDRDTLHELRGLLQNRELQIVGLKSEVKTLTERLTASDARLDAFQKELARLTASDAVTVATQAAALLHVSNDEVFKVQLVEGEDSKDGEGLPE